MEGLGRLVQVLGFLLDFFGNRLCGTVAGKARLTQQTPCKRSTEKDKPANMPTDHDSTDLRGTGMQPKAVTINRACAQES